jgi:ubiquinone biosynthesis protein
MSGDEEMFSKLGHVADRLAMAIIVAGLFIGSSVVYFARIQPVIFGIPVIGFVGYVVALILAVVVIRDILKR